MHLADFLDLAERYTALGGSVQEQLKAVAADSRPAVMRRQNPNALAYIVEFLGYIGDRHRADQLGDEAAWLRDEIQEFLDYEDEEEDE